MSRNILKADDRRHAVLREGFTRLAGYSLEVDALEKSSRLLLIDTCGETAGVAVCAEGQMLAVETLTPGRASAEILAVVRRLLKDVGWRIAELAAVGVVSGPGSFTGVRTGLAAAMGLCEATGIRLVGVSRLVVLANAAGMSSGLVALDAGRGEVYVREVASGREWLSPDAEVAAAGTSLVVAEERVAERLRACRPRMRALAVSDALPVVMAQLREGRDEDEVVNANYVRGAREIYRRVGEPVKVAETSA